MIAFSYNVNDLFFYRKMATQSSDSRTQKHSSIHRYVLKADVFDNMDDLEHVFAESLNLKQHDTVVATDRSLGHNRVAVLYKGSDYVIHRRLKLASINSLDDRNLQCNECYLFLLFDHRLRKELFSEKYAGQFEFVDIGICTSLLIEVKVIAQHAIVPPEISMFTLVKEEEER